MKAQISPSTLHGTIKLPPSKSMAHRLIICASLAKGRSTISNVAYSVDIQTTIEGMKALGAKIQCLEDSLIIDGIEDFHQCQASVIECNESGSTLRFLIPLFSLTEKKITFVGKGRLMERPQKIYEQIFQEKQLFFKQDSFGIQIQGALPSGHYTVPGNVSSQFISGLLFILPLLNEDSYIHIQEPFESKSYIDLTLQAMRDFHVHAEFRDDHTLYVKGNQHYQPCNISVEGDFSQFAFFGVAAAINHDLHIQGVSHDSLQGDKQILDILKDFQADVKETDDGYMIRKSELKGNLIDLANCPDLGPIACVLGMFAQGTTKIIHAQRLRLKESDRILAMETELAKFGCQIQSDEDSITIIGGCHAPSVPLSGWKDHRIVMALSMACTMLSGTIEGTEAIAKSYPNFYEDCQKINMEVTLYDE